MSQTRVTDPEITPAVWREMGLSDNEYEQVKGILGRNPTYTELGMYAVMWSEHCGYKYSRPVLRLFKRYREQLDSGALENAGVVDIGDGYGIAMKIESHNHPSAVEPFQGAATGVGGILRDIFTMGARPIASLNSLRFGDLDDPHVRFLFEHVVAGIGFYGNCVGVPTVGGEVCFDKSYAGNPLVNAMSAGLVKLDRIASELQGLKAIDGYVAYWRQRIAGIESWQRLAKQRRSRRQDHLRNGDLLGFQRGAVPVGRGQDLQTRVCVARLEVVQPALQEEDISRV